MINNEGTANPTAFPCCDSMSTICGTLARWPNLCATVSVAAN